MWDSDSDDALDPAEGGSAEALASSGLLRGESNLRNLLATEADRELAVRRLQRRSRAKSIGRQLAAERTASAAVIQQSLRRRSVRRASTAADLERARRLAPRAARAAERARLEALAAEVAQRERELAEKLLAATRRQKERVVEDGAARVVQRAVRGRAGGLWLLNAMTERRRRQWLAEQRQRQVEDASALCLQRFARGAIARRRPRPKRRPTRAKLAAATGGRRTALPPVEPPVALLPRDAAILPGRKYVPLLPAAPTRMPLALYAFGALEYSLLVYLPRQDALALLRMRRRVLLTEWLLPWDAVVGRAPEIDRVPAAPLLAIARARHLGRGAPLGAPPVAVPFLEGAPEGASLDATLRTADWERMPRLRDVCARCAGPLAASIEQADEQQLWWESRHDWVLPPSSDNLFGVHWHRLPHMRAVPGTFPPVAPRGRAPLPIFPPRRRAAADDEAFGGGVEPWNEELRRTAPPPPPSALSPPRHDGLVFDPRASWRSAELYQGRAGLETLERALTRSRSVA